MGCAPSSSVDTAVNPAGEEPRQRDPLAVNPFSAVVVMDSEAPEVSPSTSETTRRPTEGASEMPDPHYQFPMNANDDVINQPPSAGEDAPSGLHQSSKWGTVHANKSNRRHSNRPLRSGSPANTSTPQGRPEYPDVGGMFVLEPSQEWSQGSEFDNDQWSLTSGSCTSHHEHISTPTTPTNATDAGTSTNGSLMDGSGFESLRELIVEEQGQLHQQPQPALSSNRELNLSESRADGAGILYNRATASSASPRSGNRPVRQPVSQQELLGPRLYPDPQLF